MQYFILLEKVYFLVHLKSCHAHQSPPLANTGKYTSSRASPIQDFPYRANSTGRIFSYMTQLRTLAWPLCPMSCLSIRIHEIWPRIFLSVMCYEGILKIENIEGGTLVAHPAGKIPGLSAH